jgi:hypothetical protein
MNNWEAIGYVASTLVLTAFGMKSIIPLRVVAMCSNLMFVIYGLGLGLTPKALGGRNGAHLLRQAADDESIVGGSMIPWLRNRAQPKLAETQRLDAEKHAVAYPPYHLASRADLARAFAGREVEKKWACTLSPSTAVQRGARLLRVKRTCELHKTPDICLGLPPDRRASAPIVA